MEKSYTDHTRNIMFLLSKKKKKITSKVASEKLSSSFFMASSLKEHSERINFLVEGRKKILFDTLKLFEKWEVARKGEKETFKVAFRKVFLSSLH